MLRTSPFHIVLSRAEFTELSRRAMKYTLPNYQVVRAAMVAATSGNVGHFRDARHFVSWFGITPKEYSSGARRHLGHISKRGDRYLRILLTHGARAVLRSATVAVRAGKTVDGLRQWALAVQARSYHNKATCALANKLARICYAALRDSEPYGSGAFAKENLSHRLPSASLSLCAPHSPHPEPCLEIDRPSWPTGSSPLRLTPITLPAASCLPLVTIGAAGSADSMSARAFMSPLQMLDIRLQAHPR